MWMWNTDKRKKYFARIWFPSYMVWMLNVDYWGSSPPQQEILPRFYVDLTFCEWKPLKIKKKRKKNKFWEGFLSILHCVNVTYWEHKQKNSSKDLMFILFCVNVNVDYWESPPQKKFPGFYVHVRLCEYDLLRTNKPTFAMILCPSDLSFV